MSFPYMNAQSVSRTVSRGVAATTTGIAASIPTGPYNLFSVPGTVDVSAMEMSIGVIADSISGSTILAIQTGSPLTVSFSDGANCGANTTVSLLVAAIGNTVAAFADTIPQDMAGTSTTDLDADDWVNFHVTANPTTIPGVGVYGVNVNYIYGKPGAIN
jgi:hypothetical protein